MVIPLTLFSCSQISICKNVQFTRHCDFQGTKQLSWIFRQCTRDSANSLTLRWMIGPPLNNYHDLFFLLMTAIFANIFSSLEVTTSSLLDKRFFETRLLTTLRLMSQRPVYWTNVFSKYQVCAVTGTPPWLKGLKFFVENPKSKNH